VSCKITSIDEFAKITPVIPPTVNKKTNPKDHNIEGE
jgi:hypothetical protein